MTVEKESGEWLDKEPRKDGKPRRWKPFEVRQARRFIPQEHQTQRPSEDIRPHDGMQDIQLFEAPQKTF